MIPIALSVLFFMRPASLQGPVLPLTLLVLGALLYFAALARRIYASQLNSLAFQSEKDMLIDELEQARANSDEARRRAEEASLAKSRFLATMSHELRTPLNAILGFSEVMKTELFGVHTVAAYRDYSGDIHASGEHLLTLINEILDLSRVEAGRYELKEEAVLAAGRDRGLPCICWPCAPASASVDPDRRGRARHAAPVGRRARGAPDRAQSAHQRHKIHAAGRPGRGQGRLDQGRAASIFPSRTTGPAFPNEEIPLIMSSFGRGSMALQNACEGTGPRPAHRQGTGRIARRQSSPCARNCARERKWWWSSRRSG